MSKWGNPSTRAGQNRPRTKLSQYIEMEQKAYLVGVGLFIMDSSMLVATITGLPRLRQPCKVGNQGIPGPVLSTPIACT